MPETTQHRAVPGTVFACSWGYDQTNVTYYVVLKATPKMAYIAEIKNGDPATIGVRAAHGDTHKLPNGTIKRLGLFKIHDTAVNRPEGITDAQHEVFLEKKYSLWFAPFSFANAYWWRGEELYQTPFNQGH